MNQNNKQLRLATLQLKELRHMENRAKMCYAFAKSPRFYNQELAIMNPRPSHYVPGFVAPRDTMLYYYEAAAEEAILSLEKYQELACDARAPVVCTGSHKQGLDRSLQLFALPQDEIAQGLEPADLLIVRFLTRLSKAEEARILNDLEKAYYELSDSNSGH